MGTPPPDAMGHDATGPLGARSLSGGAAPATVGGQTRHRGRLRPRPLTSSRSSSGVAGALSVLSVLQDVSDKVSESTDSSSNPKNVSTTCFCEGKGRSSGTDQVAGSPGPAGQGRGPTTRLWAPGPPEGVGGAGGGGGRGAASRGPGPVAPGSGAADLMEVTSPRAPAPFSSEGTWTAPSL